MPLTKEPKPLPSDLTYVPDAGAPYRVGGGDSFYTLASRPEVKAAGMSPVDLAFFNFRTRNPTEINWYLYHKVGCRKATGDGKNYVFSSSDSPGVIYLPKVGPPPPVNVVVPPPAAERAAEKTKAWIGIGGKAGTQFFAVGIETLTGYVASLDDLGKGMAITASINRLGPGFGVSGGLCIIYVTGVERPGQLNGHQQGDWDFNVSLGGNWGKIANGAAKAKKLQPLIDVIKTIGAKTPGGLKAALKASPDKWVELVKAGKSVNEFMGLDPKAGPNVLVVDVPLGAGVEASVFYGVSNFNAIVDNTY